MCVCVCVVCVCGVCVCAVCVCLVCVCVIGVCVCLVCVWCVCVFVCVCMQGHCRHMRVCACVYTCVCTHVCMCVNACVHLYTCLYPRVWSQLFCRVSFSSCYSVNDAFSFLLSPSRPVLSLSCSGPVCSHTALQCCAERGLPPAKGPRQL